MRLVGLLLALALPLAAQSSLADQARKLLDAQSYRDKAWGAWYAGASHDPALRPTLLTHLRAAASLSDAARDSEPYAYTQALLDALIQLPGITPNSDTPNSDTPNSDTPNSDIPNPAILPFETSRRAEVLILMSRNPPRLRGESDLLAIRQHTLSDVEADTVDGLLYPISVQRFSQRTLEELRITSQFVVTDQAVGFCGGATGCGIGKRRFPAGFPPIALYQLWTAGPDMRPGDTLLLQDPAPVYYRRIVVPTDGEAEWTECSFSAASQTSVRQMHLARFFSAAGGLPADRADQVFHPRTTIQWHDAMQAATDIERALEEQSASIQATVAEAQRRGLVQAAGMRIVISTSVQDVRRNHTAAVPKVEPRELVIQ